MKEQTQICIRIINENIRNVMIGGELTMPLRQLNADCRFKKFYEEYCDNRFGSRMKEYREKNKDKIKEYYKEYREKNKDKIAKRGKEYNKEYREKNKDKK